MNGRRVAVGRTLIAAGVPKAGNNGADEAPAIVTRVFENYVNARVLLDGPQVAWWTSISVYGDKAAYEAAAEQYDQQHPGAGPLMALYWPTIV